MQMNCLFPKALQAQRTGRLFTAPLPHTHSCISTLVSTHTHLHSPVIHGTTGILGFFLLRVEVVRKGLKGRMEKGADMSGKGAEDPLPFTLVLGVFVIRIRLM